ncbi:hypothetical protein KIN20_021548, partial [Parelaphostrongylus tenuis]
MFGVVTLKLSGSLGPKGTVLLIRPDVKAETRLETCYQINYDNIFSTFSKSLRRVNIPYIEESTTPEYLQLPQGDKITKRAILYGRLLAAQIALIHEILWCLPSPYITSELPSDSDVLQSLCARLRGGFLYTLHLTRSLAHSVQHQPPTPTHHCEGAAVRTGRRMPKDKRRDEPSTEVDHVDRNLTSLNAIPRLFEMTYLTRLTLSHNKLTSIPPNIANLENLQILTLWNNQIEELPSSISSLSKLRILNVGMNRLNVLPRGFGSFKSLEILDLTYNNLNERSLPGNFFFIETLRALYLGDNDFEMLPGDVMNLRNLQILVLRDNDLLTIPREIGHLTNLKELHIQGNRLTVLPPELGALDLIGNKQVLRLEYNPWITNIQSRYDLLLSPVCDECFVTRSFR